MDMEKFMALVLKNIGFSWKGLVVFLLPMIPNILYFMLPSSKGSQVIPKHLSLDIIEHGSQAIFVVVLLFFVSKKASPIQSTYTIVMVILLAIYFGCWGAYYLIGQNLIMLLTMAVIPVVYFILAEMWLYNYSAIVPTLIFGIVHTVITYMDYQALY
jgi:hypothetical protein